MYLVHRPKGISYEEMMEAMEAVTTHLAGVGETRDGGDPS